MTDSEYIQICEKSTDKAQRILFDEYYNYVRTVVFNKLRNCGTPEDIDECVSDVFSDVFIYCDSMSGNGGDLKGIISTVANRRAVNMYHRLVSGNGNTVSYEEGGIYEMPDSTQIETEAENSELRNILMNCIIGLGEPDSTIIIQKYYFNEPSKEIGKNLKLSAESVRVRSGRALKKLRKALTQYGINLREV